MLKGRMAESLVEELLKASNYRVYRFGYEAVLQNLTQIENTFDKYGDVAEQIRNIPDFIVIGPEGKPIFVEVKFRWSPSGDDRDIKKLESIAQSWPAKIIFVNCSEKPYFRISEPPYLDNEKNLISNPLVENADFKLNTNVIEDMEKLIDKYISPTLRTNNGLIHTNSKIKLNALSFSKNNRILLRIEKIIKELIK